MPHKATFPRLLQQQVPQEGRRQAAQNILMFMVTVEQQTRCLIVKKHAYWRVNGKVVVFTSTFFRQGMPLNLHRSAALSLCYKFQ